MDLSARYGKGAQCGSGQSEHASMQLALLAETAARIHRCSRTPCHMGAHTAALNEHLWRDSDDDDDGADEDAAQTIDQTPPEDAAVTSEPAARAFDDCCKVCLISRKDPRRALVPCGHQRFCESCAETVHHRRDRCPLCRADIIMILRLY